MNILTSVNGFLDLALSEPDRATRYSHMMRARKEIRRAINIAQDLRMQIEAKANLYGED